MIGYAIITGARQGIGKAAAELFLKNHWQVINISRQNCDIPEVININIDLSDSNWHQQHSKKLTEIFVKSERVCLVQNAATFYKDNIHNLNITEFRRMLEINVVAPLQLNQIFLNKMAAGSSIIYIGSTLATKAVPDTASYLISKHALIGIMRATAQDLSHPEIHTCCICPGFTETEMVHKQLKNDIKLHEAAKKRVYANRLVQPEEIASLIFYTANNPAINGSIIHANLGQIET